MVSRSFSLLTCHYGNKTSIVYDSGSLFEPSVLDITEEDLLQRFISVRMCSALFLISCFKIASCDHIYHFVCNVILLSASGDLVYSDLCMLIGCG